ncbi:MAG: NAD(+)/NADH kinase [Candidatus Sumerlaeia bacterium]
MKVKVVDGENRRHLEPILAALGFRLADKDPETIITYGGDGTLLGAERDFPGVPKLPIRDGDPTDPATRARFEQQLKKLILGEYTPRYFYKLIVSAADEHLYALNDVTVRQIHQPSSLRYRLWVNGVAYPHEVVGDGIVVATTFGSTAYYRSITNSIFQVGIGLAFNNSTEPISHQVLREDAVIVIRITRGPAGAFADNNPRHLTLNVGEEATIRQSDQRAVILGLENLRGQDFHLLK